MQLSQIAEQRLCNQQLAVPRLQTPADLVGWFGAVQAQEYAHAKWALGLRLRGVTDDAIEQAFADGSILRTHVMRPTWHFVRPADIRWMLALTAPRVHAVNAFMYRKLELDDALFERSNAVIANALQGGQQRTRAELAAALQQAGIVAAGMRLAYIMQRAELDAIVCSGARRGKQFTYALLAERAPQAKTLPRDEALAELTRRYFTSHGPAMIHDCAWWSGLSVADVKIGLELIKPHVVREVIAGKTYWYVPSTSAVQQASPTAYLLPVYDEYTIAYKDHSAILDPHYAQQVPDMWFSGVIVIDGQVIGAWKRVLGKETVMIESTPFRALMAAEDAALTVAAQRYAAYLGMALVLPEASTNAIVRTD